MTYMPEKTISYKTYVKRALVEALREVFAHHVDEALKETRVNIDYPRSEADYPTVIVRFFERQISNAGLNHVEHLALDNPDGTPAGNFKFQHYLYKGDLEFAVSGLSSLDRDLIADTLVQTLVFGRLTDYTNRFFRRIYTTDDGRYPDSVWHTLYVNTDEVTGFGESQQKPPWGAEDDLVYQTSYRVQMMGDFYSLPPNLPVGLVEHVTLYPYTEQDPVPQGNPDDSSEWEP